MTRKNQSSGLFYYGTNIEVQLGDKVQVKRWLRRPIEGIVCYIPGISRINKSLEFEDVKQWAIKNLKNGTVYPILYDPDNFQPPKKISFVKRSNPRGLNLKDSLE